MEVMILRCIFIYFNGEKIMTSRFPKWLNATLWFIAIVQFTLGIAFLAVPEQAAQSLGLSAAPGWANWLFGMMAARFLGFGYGMVMAVRHPEQARPWIKAMVAIQAMDWLVTLKYLYFGAVTLAQVSTASFLPVVFVVVLLIGMRRSAQAV
ncbi:hypothetical protein [Rhodoferax sp. UBA5149]|uniref:hypothetical protein n=1 Tax=Rhodoferax sp. UBA5149 TaxID=1947379 RepID=UPI0025DAB3ED|nr:hypothetical protein [Rhodoferax sp. UBA5149]